jgi:VWFA-related protein
MFLFGPARPFSPTTIQSKAVSFGAVRRTPVCLLGPRRAIADLLLLLLCSLLGQSAVSAAARDDGIRIDLPASRQLRVENQFGDVDIRVVKERDVLVSATVDGNVSNRSPVIIETKQEMLLISVVRLAGERAPRVNLTLTIPENSRAEIVTGAGSIFSHGLSDSLLLTTGTGQIHADVDAALDADITARSSAGLVQSKLGSTAGNDGHNYHFRIGDGKRSLHAGSQSGDIVLSAQSSAVVYTQPGSRVPELKRTEPVTNGAGTPANQAAIEEVDEGDVIRVDAQLVSLSLSVVDRSTNRGVFGLNRTDFTLFEDGVEQKILQFDSASAPFDLVLLIDLSGSTRDVVKLIRAAARKFVDAARPSDRIAIITFAGAATVVSPLTLDREALRQRVNAIDTLPGDTKLYDAADFAMAEVLRETKNSRRAAVVLMSDGLDGSIPGVQGEGSKIPYQDLLNTIREFDGVFYALWLDTYYEALNPQDTQPEAFDMGHDRMKEVADAGGGLFYEVDGLDDLAGAYQRVVADLGTVYSLSYRPLNKTRDRKWRTIRVNVSHTNAVARGKHGYYAN